MTDLNERETFWRVEVTRRKDLKGTTRTDCSDFSKVLDYVQRFNDVEEIIITKMGHTP